MEHPNEEQRNNQAKFLNECPPEQKEFHATIFRLGNAAYVYHQLAQETSEKTLKMYYAEWLEGLPDNIRKSMEKRGFDGCKTAFPYTRYVNERNDAGMDEWMREHLTPEDYRWYKAEPGTRKGL